MTQDYADDHLPANNKPPPPACPAVYVPPPPQLPAPTHDEVIDLVIKALRFGPKREPAAKAGRLYRYALTLERLADSDEEWAAMRLAAQRLREIAGEIIA